MNIQSIRNKLDEIQCFVKSHDCDILCLVETWLDQLETDIYKINNYQAVHSCRRGRGGGAAVYIRNDIKVRELETSKENDSINWICLAVGEDNLKVSVMYKPPSISNTELLTFFESILLKYPKKHLIVGDTNLNLLELNNSIKNYKNIIALNNFRIRNEISENMATRVTDHSKTIIDHIIAENSIDICDPIRVEDTPLSDHKLLTFSIAENIKIHKQKRFHHVKKWITRSFKMHSIRKF